MSIVPILLAADAQRRKHTRQRYTASQGAAFESQGGVIRMGYLRDSWTEEGVLSLPSGQEHRDLERKAGALADDQHEFRKELAIALSAFANSGGGNIVLGQRDDGTFDGVPPFAPRQQSRTSFREWLEQIAPNLVRYPLEEIKIHTVQGAPANSLIPEDRTVIVIDIGDSRLAPHQAAFPPDNPQYYYREGGRSVPAPHHYLEVLRNRLVAAVLTPKLASVGIRTAFPYTDGRYVLELDVVFHVSNSSRIACHEWTLDVQFSGGPRYITNREIREIGRTDGVQFNRTILPTRTAAHHAYIGIALLQAHSLRNQLHGELMSGKVHFYAISENHVGEQCVNALIDATDLEGPIAEATRLLKNANISFTP